MAELGNLGGRDNHRVYKFKLVKQGTAEWLRHAQPATEEEATALSVKLNRALVALYPLEEVAPPRGTAPLVSDGVYFKLFRQVDHRHTGSINYSAFLDMVRYGLRVNKQRASNARLASAWRYVDNRATLKSM